jgi:1-acyl-sn-glycerol-3-phosphate acyltransferase
MSEDTEPGGDRPVAAGKDRPPAVPSRTGRNVDSGELHGVRAAAWQGVRVFVTTVIRLFFRTSYTGLEHLPTSGAFIVAPVHRSNVDFILLPGLTRRRMRFLGKEAIWKVAWLAPLWNFLGGIKVERGTPDRESLRICVDALRRGEPLVVFPEGTRREGETITDIFDGAAYLSLKTGVPIVPVGIGGSERAMPRGAKLPKPVRLRVVVGAPLNTDPTPDRAQRSAVRALTAELHSTLQSLYDEARRHPR